MSYVTVSLYVLIQPNTQYTDNFFYVENGGLITLKRDSLLCLILINRPHKGVIRNRTNVQGKQNREHT